MILITNLETLLEAVRAGESVEYIFFWSGCLSNWYPAKFTAEGVQYATTEQYYMAHKARVFNDSRSLKKILRIVDPREAKMLGRKIKGFDVNVWKEHRENIMIAGNMSKFLQNIKLKKYLISTGEKVLVEASPYDQIWGIGMGEGTATIKDPTTWRGLNLLGFCLMNVRRRLQANGEV